MHHYSHTIIQLAIHLPEQQDVCIIQGHEEQALLAAHERDTHLTAWVKLNLKLHLLCSDIPTYFTFDSLSWQWRKWPKGGDKVISRMYAVFPNQQERYFLRIALLPIPGV